MSTLRMLKRAKRGPGTWVARYGTSLVCVRYRYDEDTREHPRPVELVIQWRSGAPETDSPAAGNVGSRAAGAAAQRLAPRIGSSGRDPQRRVESAGGW
ncbi:MAG: hypothetical protein GY719_36775 [bacterium]|nr:hypothetical protein [bacterium]